VTLPPFLTRPLAWALGPVALGVVLLAFVIGAPLTRCAPPAREEERREVRAELHQVEQEQRQDERAKVRHVETRTERRPGGGVVIVRTEDERTEARSTSATARTTEASAAERDLRVIVRERPSWRVTAQAGWATTRPTIRPEIYGAEVSRRIVGPAWLGVWARTDKTAGVSLAVEW
jgi:hypothetical protein